MTRARECGTKRQHATRAAAEGHIWWMVSTLGARRARFRAYRCKHCGCWHVGHARKGRHQK